MKVFILISARLTCSQFANVFDFLALENGAKKLSETKKQQDNNEELTGEDKVRQKMQALVPFYSEAKPDSNVDEVENNKFELRKKKKVIA